MQNNFPQKAMVLAAGLGKRMRSYDDSIPKPLVKVAGKALIDWSLDLLVESGIETVVVNTSYMAEAIEAHLQARHTPHILISREEGQPLETGGGIRKALPLLGDAPFFVLNSDVICTNGAYPLLRNMAAAWDGHRMDGLLLMTPLAQASGYYGRGDFFMDGEGVLRRRGEQEIAPFIFAGVQMLHPRMFDSAPEGAFSMNLLYNRGATEDKTLPHIRGITHDGLWLHVGDAEGVAAAERRLTAV